MQIAYLTPDEVHRDLAVRLAEDCGATVQPLSPNDPLPTEQFDAVLYDLDYLPPAQRQELLVDLAASSATRPVPVGVHSYNLDDQVSALRRHGVVVARRLGPGVFRSLSRSHAVEPDRVTVLVPNEEEAASRASLLLEIRISTHGVILTSEC
jgi:hypothetical protein